MSRSRYKETSVHVSYNIKTRDNLNFNKKLLKTLSGLLWCFCLINRFYKVGTVNLFVGFYDNRSSISISVVYIFHTVVVVEGRRRRGGREERRGESCEIENGWLSLFQSPKSSHHPTHISVRFITIILFLSLSRLCFFYLKFSIASFFFWQCDCDVNMPPLPRIQTFLETCIFISPS